MFSAENVSQMQKNDLFGGKDSFNEGRRLPSSGGVASPQVKLAAEAVFKAASRLQLHKHSGPDAHFSDSGDLTQTLFMVGLESAHSSRLCGPAVTHRSAACSRAGGQLLRHFW